MEQMKTHLVLAEDNPGDVFLVRRALDTAGIAYDMQVCMDGEQALKYFAEAEEGKRSVELMLIDLNLPRHDGLEVLAELRKCPSLEQVPVIVLTSSDSPRDRERSFKLGAARYFQKPTDLKQFLELGRIVKELIAGPLPSPA
jgi:DNA-binding response OmpR family regulator